MYGLFKQGETEPYCEYESEESVMEWACEHECGESGGGNRGMGGWDESPWAILYDGFYIDTVDKPEESTADEAM